MISQIDESYFTHHSFIDRIFRFVWKIASGETRDHFLHVVFMRSAEYVIVDLSIDSLRICKGENGILLLKDR